jgi:hypothetical protein
MSKAKVKAATKALIMAERKEQIAAKAEAVKARAKTEAVKEKAKVKAETEVTVTQAKLPSSQKNLLKLSLDKIYIDKTFIGGRQTQIFFTDDAASRIITLQVEKAYLESLPANGELGSYAMVVGESFLTSLFDAIVDHPGIKGIVIVDANGSNLERIEKALFTGEHSLMNVDTSFATIQDIRREFYEALLCIPGYSYLDSDLGYHVQEERSGGFLFLDDDGLAHSQILEHSKLHESLHGIYCFSSMKRFKHLQDSLKKAYAANKVIFHKTDLFSQDLMSRFAQTFKDNHSNIGYFYASNLASLNHDGTYLLSISQLPIQGMVVATDVLSADNGVRTHRTYQTKADYINATMREHIFLCFTKTYKFSPDDIEFNSSNILLSQVKETGDTAFHLAVKNNNLEGLTLLLNLARCHNVITGQPIHLSSLTNKDGKSPLDLAMDSEIRKLLNKYEQDLPKLQETPREPLASVATNGIFKLNPFAETSERYHPQGSNIPASDDIIYTPN